MVYSLQTCKKFLSNPSPAKFWKSNVKLSVSFHTISPHIMLSSTWNFSLLELFCFYSTSAIVAQKDKTAALYYSSAQMWCIFHLETQHCTETRQNTALMTENQWSSCTLCFLYAIHLIARLIQQNLSAFFSTSSPSHDTCNARVCSLKTKITWCI